MRVKKTNNSITRCIKINYIVANIFVLRYKSQPHGLHNKSLFVYRASFAKTFFNIDNGRGMSVWNWVKESTRLSLKRQDNA